MDSNNTFGTDGGIDFTPKGNYSIVLSDVIGMESLEQLFEHHTKKVRGLMEGESINGKDRQQVYFNYAYDNPILLVKSEVHIFKGGNNQQKLEALNTLTGEVDLATKKLEEIHKRYFADNRFDKSDGILSNIKLYLDYQVKNIYSYIACKYVIESFDHAKLSSEEKISLKNYIVFSIGHRKKCDLNDLPKEYENLMKLVNGIN